MTAARHSPGWDISVREIPTHNLRAASGSVSHAANHHKLTEWRRLVVEAPDGAQLLLVDADTFVVAPLDPLWDIPFDFAYTTRIAARYPFNAGVIAVRVSPRTRRWMDAWLAQDRAFLTDNDDARPWRAKYGGQNQASLGALLESDVAAALGLTIAALPCSIWNAEDTCWASVDAATRIVHVKSALRMDAFQMARSPRTHDLATTWRNLDGQARAAAGAA